MTIQINGTTGISGVSGSAGTPALQGSDTNTGVFFGTDEVSIATNGTQRAVVDSSGRLLVGTSTIKTANSGLLEVNGANMGLTTFQNNAFAFSYVFTKSRGTTLGTIVNSGDEIGTIQFRGDDGSGGNGLAAAFIQAFVDGTPGANDMPGRLVFSTTADGASSPTERMRITSNPLSPVLIGQTSNPATSTVVVAVQTGSANGINAQITSNTGTSFPWANYNASGTYVGGITCTSTATSFPTSSDYRLKQNVQPLVNAAALVAQLKPSTFEFKEDTGTQVQGFIAHELQEVVPLAVIGEKDAEDANGNPVYQGVDAAKLVPLLTAALQEAMERIETLEAANAALADRITALEVA